MYVIWLANTKKKQIKQLDLLKSAESAGKLVYPEKLFNGRNNGSRQYSTEGREENIFLSIPNITLRSQVCIALRGEEHIGNSPLDKLIETAHRQSNFDGKHPGHPHREFQPA